jgi:hypothetical protein
MIIPDLALSIRVGRGSHAKERPVLLGCEDSLEIIEVDVRNSVDQELDAIHGRNLGERQINEELDSYYWRLCGILGVPLLNVVLRSMAIIMVRTFCLSTSERSRKCFLKVELKVELIIEILCDRGANR